MTVVCPEGHRSESTDYCDTCGSPIGGSGSAEVTPVPGGYGPHTQISPEVEETSLDLSASQTCPFCGGLNVQDALFCEECGYDFTTGTPPMGAEKPPSSASPAQPDEPEPVTLVEVDEEGEVDEEQEMARESAMAGEVEADADEREPEQEPDPEPVPEPDPAPEPEAPPTHKARHTPPSRTLADTWVVELWVDPDWYAVQQTEEACPSAGVPETVLLTRSTALIGRPSGSLGVRPEIDAGADSAVSRRHAQLTSDGRRWWIEDLGSSNGTFVGTVGEPLPTAPLTPSQRQEIDRDDRIYVGAWTRLVLRQATESEKNGQG